MSPSNDTSAGLNKFRVAVVILLVGFSLPFYQVAKFCLSGELYSYILLIPFVSLYFAWLQRDQLKNSGATLPPLAAALALAAGTGCVVMALLLTASYGSQDQLAVLMYAFVLLLTGTCFLFLPRSTVRQLAFPLGFLVFLAPMPVFMEKALQSFLQHGSAIVADGLFQLAGTPVYRDGTIFRLPGFSMQVARECSGINSTVALFVTSIVTGRLLLSSPLLRFLLTLAVIPIALVRNGVRVVTIGELCVHVGPEMIDSYIHHHGGPIFFALSLIPFFLLVLLLVKIDRRPTPPLHSATPH